MTSLELDRGDTAELTRAATRGRHLDSSRFGGQWAGCLDSREVSGYGFYS